MIIDEADYIYLEHYGTKGMHWGVRKSRNKSSGTSKDSNKEPKKGLSKQQKQMLAIGGAVAAATGAIIVGHILLKNKQTKVSSIKQTPGIDRAIREIRAARSTPMSHIRPPAAIPMGPIGGSSPASRARTKLQEDIKLMGARRSGMSRSENQKTIDLLQKRHTELNRAANADLRRWFERSQTPMHRRNYLNDDPYGLGK